MTRLGSSAPKIFLSNAFVVFFAVPYRTFTSLSADAIFRLALAYRLL